LRGGARSVGEGGEEESTASERACDNEEDEEMEGEEEENEKARLAASNKTTVVEGRVVSVMDSRAKARGVLLTMGGYLYNYRYTAEPKVNTEKTAADIYGCQFQKSGCPAKLWVKAGTADYLMESVTPHDHGADPVDVQRRQAIEKTIDMMTSRPERKVRDVMTDALAGFSG